MGVLRQWLSHPWHRLAYIFRYSTVPTIHRESVAEHTFFVMLWAYAMAIDLQDRGVNVSMELILRRALVHDFDEALTGDFIRTFKYSSRELHEAIVKETTSLMENLNAPRELLIDWKDAKGLDVEGQVVALADHFSIVVYAIREVKLGNEFAGELLERLPKVIEGKTWDPRVRIYAEEAVRMANEASESKGEDRAEL